MYHRIAMLAAALTAVLLTLPATALAGDGNVVPDIFGSPSPGPG